MATNIWRGARLHQAGESSTRLALLLGEIAYLLFVVTNILSICAVKLGAGGLPFRMWTLLGTGVLLFAADSAQVMQAVRETFKLLLVIAAAALLGFAVSMIAHAPLGEVLRQIIEIHVQALVGVVISYTLLLRFGVPRVLAAFLIGYGITAAVAIGQALNIGLAWRMRERVAAITSDSIFNILNYDPHERAMGMSYTPVLFATQTCVALAAWFYIRIWQGAWRVRKLDWTMLAVIVVLTGLCVITGNRSPLIGIAAFTLAFILVRRPALAALLLPAALLVVSAVAINADRLGESGIRVARTDTSSSNRSTLRSFGTFLVERRPLGYGLTFDSTRKWPMFYGEVIYMPNPMAIRQWALHNYYLSILTKYGLLILFMLAWVLPRRREHWVLWMAFLPYMVHIFYHNDGPLQGDFLVFYAFAAALMLARRPELFRLKPAAVRPDPWRRAFAQPAALAAGRQPSVS